MTPPGKRVQTLNAPGSETGPGTVATWGRAITNEVNALGFKWEWMADRANTFLLIGVAHEIEYKCNVEEKCE